MRMNYLAIIVPGWTAARILLMIRVDCLPHKKIKMASMLKKCQIFKAGQTKNCTSTLPQVVWDNGGENTLKPQQTWHWDSRLPGSPGNLFWMLIPNEQQVRCEEDQGMARQRATPILQNWTDWSLIFFSGRCPLPRPCHLAGQAAAWGAQASSW